MNPLEEKKLELKMLVSETVLSLYDVQCQFEIIRPRSHDNGCLSATAALSLGRALKRPPVEIAAEIAEAIKLPEGEYVRAMGKGFVNFFLKPDFLLSALSYKIDLPHIELPDLSNSDFSRIYPAARLCAVLKNQGMAPDGSEKLSLLTRTEETRLLWAIFGDNEAELAAAAMNFYDIVGLKCGYPPLAMARYILLGNAVGILFNEYGGNSI